MLQLVANKEFTGTNRTAMMSANRKVMRNLA